MPQLNMKKGLNVSNNRQKVLLIKNIILKFISYGSIFLL